MGEPVSLRLKNYSQKQVLSAAKNLPSAPLHKWTEKRNLLKALMENTEVQLAYLDPEFNFVLVNSAYALGSGYTKEQLICRNHFELFPNQENEKIFRRVVRTGRAVKFYRKPLLFPNQPERGITYWDWTLSPIKSSRGKVGGLVLSLVDVTEDVKSDTEREELLVRLEREQQHTQQLKIEAERRAAEMDAIFMAMPDPLIVYNTKGEAVSINPATLLTFGYDPIGMSSEEVIRRNQARYPDGTIIKPKETGIYQALHGKTVVSRPFVLKNDRGEEIAVLLSASPIYIKGKTSGAVIIMHDVSERLKLEQQKDEFIAIASHELKTPITTLKAFVQILQKRLTKKADQENRIFLDRMDGQLEKLATLVKEMLDVSRIESGIIPLHNERFDFDPLIYEAIDDLQRISHRHHLIIRGSTGKKIWGDKNRLTQVVTNLILNAIKYSPTTDKVIVHLLNNNHNVIIKVRDFGIGIAKEDQAKIFERFFRVKGASGERFPGLGLGLYISAEIIRAHGGKIWVKSTPQKGSTFFFSLPIKIQKR